MTFTAFYFGSSTNHDSTLTCLVSILHSLNTINSSTCREVWSRNILHQAISIDIRIIDISTATVNHLAQVVGRDICSHTYSNTITAIHKEIRNLCWHDGRFLKSIIKVVHHVNGLLIEVVHDVFTHLGKTALCITHSSRRVAIHRTEVTLSVDESISHIPFLTHTNQGAIYRRVTMWVVLTEHLTYNTRTFLIWFVTGVSNSQHTVKNTAVHRLETITYIREGTSHNH